MKGFYLVDIAVAAAVDIPEHRDSGPVRPSCNRRACAVASDNLLQPRLAVVVEAWPCCSYPGWAAEPAVASAAANCSPTRPNSMLVAAEIAAVGADLLAFPDAVASAVDLLPQPAAVAWAHRCLIGCSPDARLDGFELQQKWVFRLASRLNQC